MAGTTTVGRMLAAALGGARGILLGGIDVQVRLVEFVVLK